MACLLRWAVLGLISCLLVLIMGEMHALNMESFLLQYFASKDGWMTCDLSTLQQYFSHIRTTGRSYLKVVGMEPRLRLKKMPLVGLEPGITRSVSQWLTY